jgi:membrane-associated protein
VDRALELLARWHYAGLFVVILVEEAGVPLPVPGDLFILAMGVVAWRGGASFIPTAAVVTTATLLGASLLYLVSRHAGRPLLVRFARRFGYTAEREARLETWLTRRGALAVGLGRLVPGLRIVMTVVAGALRLRPSSFLAGTLVAGLVWSTLYFWIGWAVGAGLGEFELGASGPVVWFVVGGAGVVAAALHLGWRRRRRALAEREADRVA